jgi:phage anti-repressor protein
MNTQLSVFTFAKKLGNSISRVEPVEQEIEGLRLSNYEFQRIQEALAPIKNEDGSIKAINARDLHAWLETPKHFADWAKDAIDRAGLTEKLDFEVYHESVKNSSGGRPRIEYHLSPDAAKEIAMMTNCIIWRHQPMT